jgi:hypothetical protein
MSIFLGVVLWSGWATSYKSLVATRFIGGLSSGVIEGELYEQPFKKTIED